MFIAPPRYALTAPHMPGSMLIALLV